MTLATVGAHPKYSEAFYGKDNEALRGRPGVTLATVGAHLKDSEASYGKRF